MATAAEAAQDMTRVLDAVTQAKLFLEALDKADEARDASTARARPSALRIALQLAEAAAERVTEYLASQEASPPVNPRDGGGF